MKLSKEITRTHNRPSTSPHFHRFLLPHAQALWEANNARKDTVLSEKGGFEDQKETAFSWHLKGNVQIPMICDLGIDKRCPQIQREEVCPYLHSQNAYHWQYKNGKDWYNFHKLHSNILENKFRDVNYEEVYLPKLDSTRVNDTMKPLIDIFNSQSKVSFTTMTVSCGTSRKTFEIRHLTTASSVVSDSDHSTVFNWYFQNDQNIWELYGNDKPDSYEIEKYYQKNPKSVCSVIEGKHGITYQFDFCEFLETTRNQITGKDLKMKRRPAEFHESQQSSTCASNLKGNIEIPLICDQGIDNQCPFVNKRCPYLHAKTPYHWQFNIGKEWYNFHPNLANILERNFREPNCDKVHLPKLKPSKVNDSMTHSLFCDTSTAQFTSMLIICGIPKRTYKIRHLTTPSASILNSNHCTIFNWYFQSDERIWELYRGGKPLSCGIEDAYQTYQDQPTCTSVIIEGVNGLTYTFDFSQMIENEQRSGKRRNIRRRPAPFSEDQQSICAWHLKGNVKIPLVCILGIEGKCSAKEKCHYLHSRTTYHWQFRIGSIWFNFHKILSDTLERRYRDVNQNKVLLPALNHSNVYYTVMKSLFTHETRVNFNSMTLHCDYPERSLTIRHLTTISSAVSDSEHSTVFSWYYFCTHEGTWKPYGEYGPMSLSIETAYQTYQKKRTDNTVIISGPNGTNCQVNFAHMEEISSATGNKRKIKRRPALSQTREPRNQLERDGYELIKVDHKSETHKDVCRIIHKPLPLITILTVFRINSPQLFSDFKDRKLELEQKYNTKDLDIRKLFFSVAPQLLNDVCSENFDRDLHDPFHETPYGQGSYFYSSSACVARRCTERVMGRNILLVADVIVGEYTRGHPDMIQPPMNPNVNEVFNTTTDSDTNPTVFVKYDKREYYPAYAVWFQPTSL